MKRLDIRLVAILVCVLIVGMIGIYAGSSANRGDKALRSEIGDLRSEVQSVNGEVTEVASNVEAMAGSQREPTERVFRLPDDGGAWHVSLFVSPNYRLNRVERETASWCFTDPLLNSLRTQAHWHFYTTSNEIYKARFQKHLLGATPTLLVQDQNGNVVYCGTRGEIPVSAGKGSFDVQKMPDTPEATGPIIRRFIGRFCDRVSPTPEPAPEPIPDPGPDEQNIVVAPVAGPPDLGQDEDEDNPWWLIGVGFVVAVLITTYISFRRDM